MEVHFEPELQKKLNDLAATTGRPATELVQDAVAELVAEATITRRMLDRRYDDVKHGRVQLMDGEEAFARLMARTENERKRPA